MRKLFIAFILLGISGVSLSAATIYNNNEVSVLFQEKQYKKIEVSAVDKAAMEKIKKSYGAYTVKEAYKADDGDYKLVLSKDGVDLTATFTSAGDLIKILD